jgi:hypothetical protein
VGKATYNCAGLRIESPVQLPATIDNGEPDIVFLEGEPWTAEHDRPRGELIAERVIGGVPTYTFARCGDRVVASFYTLADFEIDLAQRRVVSHPRPGTDPGIIPILLTGTIVAFLLSMGGALVFHASAVEVDGGALAFIGHSGQGKTTLATLFCAAGYPLVTDDVLPVAVSHRGDVSCVPGGVLLRVRPKAEAVIDHLAADVPRGLTADGRHGVSPRLTRAARLQLRAAVIPLPDREHTQCDSRRLAPIEAMMTLTRFQRIEGWKSDHELRAQFAMITRVVGSVPVLAMRVPWGPPFRPHLVAEMLDVISPAPVGSP